MVWRSERERGSRRAGPAVRGPGPVAGGALMAALWLAGNVADLVTTRQGLNAGLREANPVFSHLSWRNMVVLKSAMALAIGLVFLRDQRTMKQLTAGQWAVVGWNGMMLARARRRSTRAVMSGAALGERPKTRRAI